MNAAHNAGRAVALTCAMLLSGASTSDGADIYLSYNGIIQHSRESAERLMNGVQAVAKMVELKAGDGGYVKYDVFVVR